MSQIQETPAEPVPFMKGHFSLYETPDGGYHVAYVNELGDDHETKHVSIPGPIVKMAKAASEGKMSPMGMMARMMGKG